MNGGVFIMKKLFIFSLLLFTISLTRVHAGDYVSYQELTFKHNGAKLLSQYSSDDYEDYYDRLGKRRFWGWNTFTVYKNEPVYYVRDTLYVIINEGTTPIKEEITFTRESITTKQYDVSGSIALDGSGKKGKFSLGLETKIDFSQSVTEKVTVDEKYEIEIEVDPNTKLEIKILGEGKVTNGVAKYYRFWVLAKKGGFEVFVVTTEYYSIVKVPV